MSALAVALLQFAAVRAAGQGGDKASEAAAAAISSTIQPLGPQYTVNVRPATTAGVKDLSISGTNLVSTMDSNGRPYLCELPPSAAEAEAARQAEEQAAARSGENMSDIEVTLRRDAVTNAKQLKDAGNKLVSSDPRQAMQSYSEGLLLLDRLDDVSRPGELGSDHDGRVTVRKTLLNNRAEAFLRMEPPDHG